MLDILFQDDHLVAIDKPPGLLVHRSRIDKSANRFAMQELRDQIGQLVYPVHRLDRPTSGVLLFALSPQVATMLGKQFEAHSIKKTYQAIVRGHCDDEGEIDRPLKERLDRKTDHLADTNKPPQPARTQYRRLDQWCIPFSAGKYPHSRYSLVEVFPKSGRRHQIRRHFNHTAHPIIGDSTHGDRRHNRLFREKLGIRRLLLAATRLKLVHPVEHCDLTIEAGCGVEFQSAIDRLREFE